MLASRQLIVRIFCFSSFSSHTITSGGAAAASDEVAPFNSEENLATIVHAYPDDVAAVCTTADAHAPSGRPDTVTNADGTVLSFTYTSHTLRGINFHEVAGITYPDGSTESFTYDEVGSLVRRVDRTGAVWTFGYNDRGQCVRWTHWAVPPGADSIRAGCWPPSPTAMATSLHSDATR